MSTLINSKHLGHILKARRRALGLTQKQMAGKLAITQARLSQIESDPAALTLDRLMDICHLLQLDISIDDRKQQPSTKW
jgi:HTH-type transcriptional regulator/antitoxin HipB